MALGVVALAPSPSHAHGSTNLGDFYGGLMQPLFHFDSLLLLIGFGAWVGQNVDTPRVRTAVAVAAAALVGAALGLAGIAVPGALWIVRGGALALGLLTLARLELRPELCMLLGFVLGIGQGNTASFDERQTVAQPVLYALGLALGPILVASWFAALVENLQATWMDIALRVLGSWIAAVCLLTTALAIAGPR